MELKPKYPALAQTIVLRDRTGAQIDHSELVNLGNVTIVDFYAVWCQPCRRLAPHVEALADNDPDVVLKQINIRDWDTPITKKYNISSIPDVRVFDRNGRLMGSSQHRPPCNPTNGSISSLKRPIVSEISTDPHAISILRNTGEPVCTRPSRDASLHPIGSNI